jgi:hypothetical protein
MRYDYLFRIKRDVGDAVGGCNSEIHFEAKEEADAKAIF